MKRRAILKYTALATGAALSAPLITSVLTGCQNDISSGGTTSLKFFGNEDFSLLQNLVDLIIPKTDSPSASEVGVHHMIDHMLATVYGEEDQEKYMSAFNALKEYLSNKANGSFSQLSADKKLGLINGINSNESIVGEDIKKGLHQIKQQTVAYYLSTEKIGTEYLNYLPIPGEYKSCISLDEVGGKAWAI